jgi:hypothetical protein
MAWIMQRFCLNIQTLMKTKIIAFGATVVIGCFALVNPTQAQTWTSVMPCHHWISVASSSDGNVLAAAATNGPICISKDSGASWVQAYVPETNCWSSIAISTNGNILAAVAINGSIYVSTNSGLAWKQASVPSNSWSSVAMSADGTRMLTSATNGPIYLSNDSGLTWTATDVPLTWNGYSINSWWGAVASSADGSQLMVIGYAKTGQSAYGEYFTASTDSGTSWTNTLQDFPSSAIACSADGKKVAVAHLGGWVLVWTNGIPPTGNSYGWMLASGKHLTSVASSADGSKLATAAASGEIYTSTNSGASWDIANVPAHNWSSLASSADGNKLVAVSMDGDIFVNGTVPAPALDMVASGSNSILWWNISASDYVLQQNLDLNTSNWTDVPVAPVLVNQAVLPSSGSSLFYRLRSK